MIEGKWNGQFIVDPIQGGAGTSINMNANEVIANRALELMGEEKGNYKLISPNSHINMSQSTNDAFPTATHIAILSLMDQLLEATKKCKNHSLLNRRNLQVSLKWDELIYKMQCQFY